MLPDMPGGSDTRVPDEMMIGIPGWCGRMWPSPRRRQLSGATIQGRRPPARSRGGEVSIAVTPSLATRTGSQPVEDPAARPGHLFSSSTTSTSRSLPSPARRRLRLRPARAARRQVDVEYRADPSGLHVNGSTLLLHDVFGRPSSGRGPGLARALLLVVNSGSNARCLTSATSDPVSIRLNGRTRRRPPSGRRPRVVPRCSTRTEVAAGRFGRPGLDGWTGVEAQVDQRVVEVGFAAFHEPGAGLDADLLADAPVPWFRRADGTRRDDVMQVDVRRHGRSGRVSPAGFTRSASRATRAAPVTRRVGSPPVGGPRP